MFSPAWRRCAGPGSTDDGCQCDRKQRYRVYGGVDNSGSLNPETKEYEWNMWTDD